MTYYGAVSSPAVSWDDLKNQKYNVLAISFAQFTSDGSIDLQTISPIVLNEQSISDYTSSTGTIVLLSMGGAYDKFAGITINDPEDWAAKTFVHLKSIFNQYGISGIDLDLESFFTTKTQYLALRSLIKLLHNVGYVVSIAPQCVQMDPNQTIIAPGWNKYMPLYDIDYLQYVDIIALQFYNNSSCNFDTVDQFSLWVNKIMTGWTASGGGFDSISAQFSKDDLAKIVIGKPACTQAAGSGYLNPKSLGDIYKDLKDVQGLSLGGFMFWSAEWDKATNYCYSNTLASAFDATIIDYMTISVEIRNLLT